MINRYEVFASVPGSSDFTGPHELHVTTDPAETDTELFQFACKALGVKAHVIFNETSGGETTVDYLTGSEYYGSSRDSLTELDRIAAGLKISGLVVVREKVETTPWHPLAPRLASDRLPQNSYFESHFTLPDLPTIHGFRQLKWDGTPLLISTTENKRRQGLLFATLRHYSSNATDFCRNIERLYSSLSEQIRELKRPAVEFSMFDSNPQHDRQWIDSYLECGLDELG